MAEMSPKERTRRGQSLFLNAIGERTAGDIAKAMGVSDSRVSELKNKHMEECIELLAHCGLKVTPTTYVCVERDAYAFLTAAHARVVRVAPALLWGEDDK
jgi:hypothetical protein